MDYLTTALGLQPNQAIVTSGTMSLHENIFNDREFEHVRPFLRLLPLRFSLHLSASEYVSYRQNLGRLLLSVSRGHRVLATLWPTSTIAKLSDLG